MNNPGKNYCLKVWGDFAAFNRPELKVERVSYDVITPSAARAIFSAIFWKPAIRWHITRIEVLNPIAFTSIRRNEVAKLASPQTKIYIEDSRQQKSGICLTNVAYRLFADMEYLPPEERPQYDPTKGEPENEIKYFSMFERRAANGQCFFTPYLGCREFSADFQFIPETELEAERAASPPLGSEHDRDLGLVLYDMDFDANPRSPDPMFFWAKMVNGVVVVPNINSREVLK